MQGLWFKILNSLHTDDNSLATITGVTVTATAMEPIFHLAMQYNQPRKKLFRVVLYSNREGINWL